MSLRHEYYGNDFCMFDQKKLACSFALLLLCIGQTLPYAKAQVDPRLELQRKQFVIAKNALRAHKLDTFKHLAAQLRDYPLYPYLIEQYLSSRLWKVKDREIIAFLNRYNDLPTAKDLRQDWLKYLARHHRWQTYIDNYTPQSDAVLQCYQLHARVQTHHHTYLLEDTRTLWLSGESLPPQCDSAFALLYKSKLMTSELVMKRVALAMRAGNTRLAKYLSRYLDKGEQHWVSLWIATHHNPSRWTRNPGYEDIPIARRILVHGIIRLANLDIDTAISRWQQLKPHYSFTTRQTDRIKRTLAIQAANSNHPDAIRMLSQLPNSLVDAEIFHWRLSTALREHNWNKLIKWTEGEPPEKSLSERWLYWRARALEETGNDAAAAEIFRQVAKERDYYGFLATDKLGETYKMGHNPMPEDIVEWQKISEKPAIVRAHELYLLGMLYSARREWQYAYRDMTSYQLQIAASIASNWGWHDRTILTLGQAKAYDDLILRFPLPYEKLITQNVRKRDLDLSWVYALTRAESIFMEDAQSPAGAMGLMQVKPRTGRETARTMGMKFYSSHLLQAKFNVAIGTEYLRKMYDMFNHNIIVATAAYNAGPNNVKKWLPEEGCVDPEMWVEQIPFTATRKYVEHILYYASIYDWRLRKDITPVSDRMAAVTSDQNQLVASLSCPGQQLSASLK